MWQQSAGIEWQLPPNLGACERPVAIVPPLSSAIIFALSSGLFSSAYKPNVISLLKAVNLFLTPLPLLVLLHISFPLFAAGTPQNMFTLTLSIRLLPSSLPCSPVKPWSPRLHHNTAEDAVSQVSSKSAQEPPVMLALGSSHAPLLSLCSPALRVLQLSSFPFSQASLVGKT